MCGHYALPARDRKDIHGWHWDDYSFALVWVIDSPPVAGGAFVQYVVHTLWDKDDPRLHQWFVTRPIYSLALAPGDLYFMRTDTGCQVVTGHWSERG